MEQDVIQILKNGGVAVIPTDTIYGIVALASRPESVARVYELKGRSPEKPCIILISDASAMKDFGVADAYIESIAQMTITGPTSFIVPIDRTDLSYLDRGTGTLAFRIPYDDVVREFISKTGPLIAPSANPQGKEPAKTIEEARAYFGETVDVYMDGGFKDGAPSALIDVKTGELLR